MDYRKIIDTFGKKLVRRAQILPSFNSIIFEPRGDGRSFTMSYFVPELNENVQFGILSIDKSFMKFLSSGLAPRKAWGPENAYWYYKEGLLNISDQVPQRVYEQVSQNLKLLQSGDKNKINNFVMTGINNLEVPLVPDTRHRMRNNEANELMQAYIHFSKGGQSQAVPRMAKTKPKIKISFRERQ